MNIHLAVIGGSGLYQFDGLTKIERLEVETPFGRPSGSVAIGEFAERRVAFLARHGEAHTLPPHRVNYRANLFALKSIGVTRIIGINAVGGIGKNMVPRMLAVPDQIIDYTHGRLASYCGVENAKVEHVDFSYPYTEKLRQDILVAGQLSGVALIAGGCYGVTQGPRLETVAEIARLRRDGCDLVGMTGMPEAVLARELGIDYACIALIANWAAGCGDDAAIINVEEIFQVLKDCTAQIPALVRSLLTVS